MFDKKHIHINTCKQIYIEHRFQTKEDFGCREKSMKNPYIYPHEKQQQPALTVINEKEICINH